MFLAHSVGITRIKNPTKVSRVVVNVAKISTTSLRLTSIRICMLGLKFFFFYFSALCTGKSCSRYTAA